MKRLILIGGPMGVGKTAVCRELQRRLPDNVFLDGDWCWDAVPFRVTAETKRVVMENIAFLLGQFLRCSAYSNILFCWVMHEQSIWEDLLSRLDLKDVQVIRLALTCAPGELENRLRRDIDCGVRTPDVIGRSLERLGRYAQLDISQLDTTALTPEETANKNLKMIPNA